MENKKLKSNMLLKLIIFFSFVFIGFSFIQKTENKIYWTKSYKLTWADFMDDPPEETEFIAFPEVVIDPQFFFNNGVLEIDVNCYFNRYCSWSIKEKHSNQALKHEQAHFDIAEVFARQFRKEIRLCNFKGKNVREKFDKKYEEVNEEYMKTRSLYDIETNYGLNKDKQAEWSEKIGRDLKESEDYIEPHITIKIK
jgi:hypothetical protein